MNKLTIKNDISQLELDSQEVQNTFWKSLRFRDKGYFHSPQYQRFLRFKGKGWDGFVDFFNKQNGKFGTGLLPEILKALENLKFKFEVCDQRTSAISIVPINECTLEDIKLRDYQVEIANYAWKIERGIIKAATGSGKTLLFTAIIKALPKNTPTLVLFRSKTLVNQTYEVLKKNGIENVGKIHGEAWKPNIILCTTIQSQKKYESLLDKFKILIVDEVHEFATNNSVKLFKKMKNCRYRFGFSATPWSRDDKVKKYKLKSWFGPVIGDLDAKTLQEKGVLSDSVCFVHNINQPNLIDCDYQEAYNLGVVTNNHLHKKIKEITDSYESGRILIVVERIDAGDSLAACIPGSYWVQGRDDDETRKFVIDKLTCSKEHEKVVAIASRILQTGVDIKIHALINAAGFKSDIMTIQRIGRGLRKADDKDQLDYHDFLFENNHYLKKHSIERLKHLKREGHKIIMVDAS